MRIVFVLGWLGAIVLWRLFEARLHDKHILLWQYIRQGGRITFIATRYILVRGLVLTLVFVVPSYSSLDIQAILMFIILSAFVTSMLGNQEWSDCENQYQADLLRDTATSLRAIQN